MLKDLTLVDTSKLLHQDSINSALKSIFKRYLTISGVILNKLELSHPYIFAT